MMRQRPVLVAVASVLAFALFVILAYGAWERSPHPMFDRVFALLGGATSERNLERSAAAPPERLPRLPATGWHHGGPLTADSLRGWVVVLAVFSDTHPNTFDALPQVEAWHRAYARFGVRVIGVHAPEFAFATNAAAVTQLARRLELSFPIVEDPGLAVLGALGGRGAEVHLALADHEGRLRTRVRAGDPARDLPAFELALREAVADAHPERGPPRGTSGRDQPTGTVSRVRTLRLGSASVAEGPLAGATPGRAQPFTAQFRFEVEGGPWVPYPIGWWIPRPLGIEAARGGAAQYLAIRYDAARVGVVASPPRSGSARLWILRDEAWLDGKTLGEDARRDALGASYVDIEAPGLYFVARGAGEHVLKLSPESPGLTLHALTFEPDAPPSAPSP
jgi:hypothetical protein